MSKQLTPEQISDLFLFCDENEVKYCEVQIELVDHLASAIEQLWVENPKMSYENALWKVYDSFGASGFRKFRSIKEKALQRKYVRIQWTHIADFFRLPKIILTVASCLVLYLMFKQINGDYRIVFSMLAPIIVGALAYYQFFLKKNFRIKTNNNKDFAMLDHFEHLKGQFIYYAIFPPLNVFLWGHLLLHNFLLSPVELFLRDSLSALFFVFWILLMHVFGYYLPKRVVADFRNEFPQYLS